MYVIFPAEEVLELSLRRPVYTVTPIQNCQVEDQSGASPPAAVPPSPKDKKSKNEKSQKKSKSDEPKRRAFTNLFRVSSTPSSGEKSSKSGNKCDKNMASFSGYSGENILKDLSHPSLNEHLKNHNAVTFKLVRTVSDFTQELSQMYEQHAEELQLLVTNFRKKNLELRKERPSCPSSLFQTWETLLQEVEVDSQAHSDIASVFGRQVSRTLLERSFHRKVQARKVFAHRDNFEVFINKAEDKLSKCRQDYKTAYMTHMNSPNSTASLSAYLDAHNNYVTQLHSTNGMVEQYYQKTLPQLLQELEEVYMDLCRTLSDSVLQGAEVISSRASEQYKRYENLSSQCRTVLPPQDLTHFVRSLSPLPPHPHPSHRLRLFSPPQPPDQTNGTDPGYNSASLPPALKNEIIMDRLASVQVRQKYESLRVEATELETEIKHLQDSLDSMLRLQQRSLESQVYNKVNEIQEDISTKKYDLRQAQIHLSAIRAQKELFGSKLESAEGAGGRDRKMSSSSTGSMKTKWLKAFKSLKTTSGPSNGANQKEPTEKKNGRDGNMSMGGGDSSAHQFQEYTYKKITPCDVCSQVLRGHTRQGLKCRICKTNVHIDCQEKVARCQAKSRLLRRQKSTSEIEIRVPSNQEEEDFGVALALPPAEVIRRRRLFGGIRSLSMFGSRSVNHANSISLPEKKIQYAAGTRPFGQPLVLGGVQENGGDDAQATSASQQGLNRQRGGTIKKRT